MKNFLLILITIQILFSCKNNNIPLRNYESEGFVKAEVIKYEVESCGYIIKLQDNQLLSPENLIENFKKDKLTVWVKYTFLKQKSPSICMAGKPIKVDEIAERK